MKLAVFLDTVWAPLEYMAILASLLGSWTPRALPYSFSRVVHVRLYTYQLTVSIYSALLKGISGNSIVEFHPICNRERI